MFRMTRRCTQLSSTSSCPPEGLGSTKATETGSRGRGRLGGHALPGAIATALLLGATVSAESDSAQVDSSSIGPESPSTANGNTPSPEDAYVYIGWPNSGEVINASRLPDGGFRVWFGLRNMGVAPAGVDFEHSGHFHLIIDGPLPPLDREIPSDKNHLHFGNGQTETVLELNPGRHTLQLLMGDRDHFPHKPPVYSKVTTIIVR